MQHMPHPSPYSDFTVSLSAGLPDYDRSQEIAHLQAMVAQGLKVLNTAYGQMEKVEQELQGFLQHYYAEVGPFFEQLEQLNGEIATYDRQIRQASRKRARVLGSAKTPEPGALQEAFPPVPADMSKDEIDAEIKAVYRKLAKLYHPDVAEDMPYSRKVIQLLNQAYSKKNLWAMRELEHSLVEHAGRQDAPEQKLSRLRERFDAIAESVVRVAERRKRLERSEAWQLKQRMEGDRYLVEVVIHRAKRQIDEAHRCLTRKKIEYKAVMAH